ncbi:CEP120 family protein [Megaselia abdita]
MASEKDIESYSILLHIVEGVNLHLKNNHEIVVNGTLNGIKFEVIGVNSQTSVLFDSNFIWQCPLEDIKRMKTDKRPVKLEVFANESSNKKMIGFLLLPLRGFPVCQNMRSTQIKLRWFKLIGLSAEWKEKVPELYLFLVIVKSSLIESGQFDSILAPKATESSESIFIRPSETSAMLTSRHGIFVKVLEEERLIQIGNEYNDCDIIIVTLTFKNARNLSQLIDPDHPNKCHSFGFQYDLLGTPSIIDLMPKENGLYSIQEKISISFKSSLKTLKEYFKKVFYIPIDLYYNDSIIGNYRLDFSPLIPFDDFKGFKESSLNKNHFETKGSFFIESVFDVFSETEKPSVDYSFKLQYLSPSLDVQKVEVHENLLHYAEFIDKKASGDCNLPVDEINHPKEEFINDKKENKSVQIDLIAQSKFDEDMAEKIAEELEDWKYYEMKMFLEKLKVKEQAHLNHLSKEWEKQKSELVGKLEDKLQECSVLTKELEAAQDFMKDKDKNIIEMEKVLEIKMCEMEKEFAIKTLEMQDSSRRSHNDFEHQLRLAELKIKEVELEKNMIEKENDRLRKEADALRERLCKYEKDYAPNEQLSCLMQDLKIQSDRLIEMQKSKNFYKEQWAKIIRESHILKLNGSCYPERISKTERCGCFNRVEKYIIFSNIFAFIKLVISVLKHLLPESNAIF